MILMYMYSCEFIVANNQQLHDHAGKIEYFHLKISNTKYNHALPDAMAWVFP